MTLRNTTNLLVPEDLKLPRAESRSNFMYVYTAAYVGLEPVFMQKLWLSVMFPEITGDPRYGKDRKAIRAYATWMDKNNRAGLLKLKKVNDPEDPHFVVAVPLVEFSNQFLDEKSSQMQRWFLGKQDLDVSQTVRDAQEAIQQETMHQGPSNVRNVMASEIIPRLGLDAKGQASLKACFFGLRAQTVGGLTVIFADFKINKAEAQQLTTSEWLKIRNMDLYPLLLQWQISLWGYRGDAPTSSFPMSKIAKTLPPIFESQARVNEFGISIAPDGAPVWLPEKLDNTQRYEDLFSQVGDKGDDTFCLIETASASRALATGQELKVHLPANIPVLIDWVNNRYAYTQSSGALKVQDLSRFKTCDAAHARMILNNQKLTDKEITAWVNMAHTAGVKDELFFTEEEIAAINADDPVVARNLVREGGIKIEDYWDYATSYHDRFVNDKRFVLADISTQGPEIWRPLARFIDQAQAAILANMEAVNHRYSVHGVSTRLGYMTLMAKYGNDWANTVAKANTLCSAATNQGRIDTKGALESVPLIMNSEDRQFSLLPHQVKVCNLLNDSPDFAILPVQAGGGKTPLAILDVLREIKANRSQPYLIMCPPSLVAQYVKEITYFTSGKLNVIPIETDVIKRHGVERLTAIVASAPRNTVVVCNYDVLRNKAYDVCYGTTNVKIYPVIEFLRQFNFGYVLCDEAHFLKNDSGRSRAAQQLIADIPKKRLASGTMAHDSPSDLALQIALLDPTIFGSREDFNNRFGDIVKGGRVIKWRPGAQNQIMSLIKSRVVVAKAMRKEWAALLPKAVELMHPCSLTPNQKVVYDAILNPILEQMREDAKTNPTLRKFFESSAKKTTDQAGQGNENLNEAEDEEAEDAADEDAGEGLAALLGFYLARLEQFMTAPGKDELGAKMLTGDDLRSDKVNKILKTIRMHIDEGIPGKVLVFTNFIESAEEIWEAAQDDPVLARSGILYTAANQVEDGAAFEGSANKKWMVGVENSMNTGLNFQFVSRLIRVENVWNPGTLEQGNSRINRPEMKKAEERNKIYYDWFITDKSIDVTKVSRLISKIIAVSKFENTENPAYEALPDLEVIPMSADAILVMNDWDSSLREYAEAYAKHNGVRNADYEMYREQHGEISRTPLVEAPTPKDAMLMAEVPYTSGLELFRSAEKGLIRIDAYLRQDNFEMEAGEGDTEDEAGAKAVREERQRKALEALVGKRVHTEFGDGTIVNLSTHGRRIRVALDSGYLANARMAGSFLITEKAEQGVSMREQLMRAAHDKMPIQSPVEVMSPLVIPNTRAMKQSMKEQLQKEKELKRRKAEEKEIEAAINVKLHFTISNGFLGITYFPEDDNAATALQAMGFRPAEQHVYAEIPSQAHLIKLFHKWHDAGFEFDKETQKTNLSDAFRDFSKVLKRNTVGGTGVSYRFADRNSLQNFFRMEFKPTTNANAIKPYPLLEDDSAYVVMPLRGQPGTQRAMQVKVPGIRWQRAPESLTYYCADARALASKMRDIIGAGIGISNLPELRKRAKKLQKQDFRHTEAK